MTEYLGHRVASLLMFENHASSSSCWRIFPPHPHSDPSKAGWPSFAKCICWRTGSFSYYVVWFTVAPAQLPPPLDCSSSQPSWLTALSSHLFWDTPQSSLPARGQGNPYWQHVAWSAERMCRYFLTQSNTLTATLTPPNPPRCIDSWLQIQPSRQEAANANRDYRHAQVCCPPAWHRRGCRLSGRLRQLVEGEHEGSEVYPTPFYTLPFSIRRGWWRFLWFEFIKGLTLGFLWLGAYLLELVHFDSGPSLGFAFPFV